MEIIFTDLSFNLTFIQEKTRYLCEGALWSRHYIVLDITKEMERAQQLLLKRVW